jgi:hypothetical protein
VSAAPVHAPRTGLPRGIVVLTDNMLLGERLKEELRGLEQRVLDHPHGDVRQCLFIVDEAHLMRVPCQCLKLLLTPSLTEDAIRMATEAQCLGLVTPGLDRLQLKALVATAAAVAEMVWLLEKSNTRLLRKLRERKIIALAKEVLEKRFRIDEEEAYRRIRLEATQTRRTLGEVAQAILLRYE